MRIVLFGGSGMVGQGVLREALLAADVEEVLSVVRKPTGDTRSKLREVVHADFQNFEPIARQLSGYHACFFCLGVSSVGMSEEQYSRVTYDITMAAANVLARMNPHMKFVFVSAAGSDSTEKGRTMWARVKGRAENALLKMPLDAYVFRPAMIQPMYGIKSRTRLYNALYPIVRPFVPVLKRFPKYFATLEQVGRAMLQVARRGYEKRILESEDINKL